MFKALCLLILHHYADAGRKTIDYFSEEFDSEKNCGHEKELKKLMKEKDDDHEMKRCAVVRFTDKNITDEQAWEECKKRISEKLNFDICKGMGFEKVLKYKTLTFLIHI